MVGFVLLAVGLVWHFSIPGTSRGGFAINVEGGSDVVESIALEFGPSDYSFGIEVMGLDQSDQSNCTAIIVDRLGYGAYQSGTPLDQIEALLEVVDQPRGTLELSTDGRVELHLIISNSNTNQSVWTYYYTMFPSSFYVSLTIAFSGAFTILAGAIVTLTGWKRYFVGGVALNLILFFVRTFTLSTYSLGLPPIFLEIVHVEFYNDYQFFYLSWVPRLWEGVYPYSVEMAVYIYPPLWIYTVGLLGNVPSWLPGFILFSFNVGTAIFVHKIAVILTEDERRAIFAMMLYLLNPFTLLYGSFMWLNPTPFVFFIVGAYYFALRNKGPYAIAALAIATLYKQFAVVFFPLLAVYLIKQNSVSGVRKKLISTLTHTGIFCLVAGLVSIPFLLVDASTYLGRMILWNTGTLDRLTVFIPDLWMPVHANTFFLWLGAPTWLTDFVAVLLINYVFLIACAIFVYGTFSLTKVDDPPSNIRTLFSHMLVWGLVAVLCIQLFYPRGSYKFYLLALSPFLALLFDHKDLSYSDRAEFRFKKRHLLGLLASWVILLCYRFVYFWILGIVLVFYLWKSENLFRLIRRVKHILWPEVEDKDPIDVYEMIYGEDD